MFSSAIVYFGLIMATAGLVLVVKPIRRLRIPTRWRGLGVAGAGVLLAGIGLMLPAAEARVTRPETRLDEFAPAWQFHEFHTIAVAAPPARVFEAIERVRADEIFLFRTLIWIRRFGQPVPQSIRNAGAHGESLIDVALRTTFVRLAEEGPRELVVGTVVGAPPGWRGPLSPEVFQKPLPPGFSLATMNFVVTADGSGGSVVSTETRVFANSPSARRQFAAYWRIIYPGSAIIRRMWLRAIQRRATNPNEP
jgi:hypothetical protein